MKRLGDDEKVEFMKTQMIAVELMRKEWEAASACVLHQCPQAARRKVVPKAWVHKSPIVLTSRARQVNCQPLPVRRVSLALGCSLSIWQGASSHIGAKLEVPKLLGARQLFVIPCELRPCICRVSQQGPL